MAEPTADGDGVGTDPEPEPDTGRVRVRGIYATALTRLLLDAGHEVVGASAPIRRRFDADLPLADHDATVDTTDDRQGVGVDGESSVVASVADRLHGVGVDALSWADPAPTGALFDGVVTETLGSGAVVDLGSVDGDGDDAGAGGSRSLAIEGFLPFSDADGYVDEGDAVRVCVLNAAAPWADRRSELTTDVLAYGGLATLERGREGTRVEGRDDGAARELAGMTDLLGADVPDGWGVRWSRAAADAGMDALGDALATAGERAEAIDEALADAGPPADELADPRRLVAPAATSWVWFGRECRFSLDGRRRAVTTTMPGHHRVKAGSDAASAGVDFAEALCDFGGASGGPDSESSDDHDDDLDFPFGVVTDQFGPVEGDSVKIAHGKPDGRLVVLGRGAVVDRGADGTLAVEREMSPGGSYDALGVEREAGDVALTKFREGRWWYPTVYRDSEGEPKGTYVNVCTPVECFPDAVRYVDLHVDVVKHRDGTVERVDDDELDEAEAAGNLSSELAEKARSVASALERAL
ncbi:DUF402 domain-containing protein [Halobium salinum]|uniref:Probable ribonuclease FAU-1 n=1 Tax=Halobium salinum TaxID=1364940 RepID=A0ABD5PCN6_9EURY|nr:DUF402 domain-containing protein [Halobium salinum]